MKVALGIGLLLVSGTVNAEPKWVAIGNGFSADLNSVKSEPSSDMIVVTVRENSSPPFKGVFKCVQKTQALIPDSSTQLNRFELLRPEDPDSQAAKTVCAVVHSPELTKKHSLETALEESKAILASSRWVIATAPNNFSNIDAPLDPKSIVIFIDVGSIDGKSANFATISLDRLIPEMKKDPRAYLLTSQSLTSPVFQSQKGARKTLLFAIATKAALTIPPNANYKGTYDCLHQVVTVSSGTESDSGGLGFYGSDPRSIEIAARYFCPDYSVNGATYYKNDRPN
jgi:hypothetical protein